MDDRWLSVEEIAKHLGISRDTVYKWLERRGLPGHKIGRLWKFSAREVDDWVRAGHAGESMTERGRGQDKPGDGGEAT